MTKATETGEYVVLNPHFLYSRHVEVVKRFLEQLSRPVEAGDYLDYIEINREGVRQAMGEIMADDIKAQIHENRFPIRVPTLRLHKFEPDPNLPEKCMATGSVLDSSCKGDRTSVVHTL